MGKGYFKTFNSILDTFTRLLILWVILSSVIGYTKPETLLFLKSHFEWLFAITMVGIGAVLNLEDFRPIFKRPYLVILGTVAQFGIMPALGFFIANVLKLPNELALGIILVGSVPGAMASNVISYLAKADVAYSISLTTTSTLLSPLLTPTFTYLFGSVFIEIRFWPMFFSIIKTVILPLLFGFGIKYIFRHRIENFVSIFPAISALFIALICGLVVALNRGYLRDVSLMVFTAVFLHNLLGLSFGYAAGVIYRFDTKRKRTLAIEVGMQNSGLGVVLALKHFSAQSALPNALFAIWAIITASVLAEIWGRDRRNQG